MSVRIAKWLPIQVNMDALVIEHYFMIISYMTGMMEKEGIFMALLIQNVLLEMQKWTIHSPRVKNIIIRHMFPLTLVPPTCTEAWIVCIADKICAIEETLFNR